MSSRLLGAKLLPELMMAKSQLDPLETYFNKIGIKVKKIYFRCQCINIAIYARTAKYTAHTKHTYGCYK